MKHCVASSGPAAPGYYVSRERREGRHLDGVELSCLSFCGRPITTPTFLCGALHRNEQVPVHVRQAGAVFFKNLIKQHWDEDSGGEGSIGEAVKIEASFVSLQLCFHNQHSPASDSLPPIFVALTRAPAPCPLCSTPPPSRLALPPHTQVRDGLLSLFLCITNSLQMQLGEVRMTPAFTSTPQPLEHGRAQD